MKKLVIKSFIILLAIISIGSFSTLGAKDKKKTKLEQKLELENQAYLEKTKAELAAGTADPNRKNGEMTWLGSALSQDKISGVPEIGNPELAKLLINAKGIKLNVWNILLQPERSWHFTALMEAVSQPEIVKLLLDKGASINMQDFWTDSQGKTVDGKNTPLMLAIGLTNEAETFTESAKILIDRGANIELQNWNGDNALMLSVHNAEIAKILIDKGAKLDVVNLSGQTALMLAASKYPDVVKLLIDKGANIKLRQQPKYDFSLNALDFAAQSGNIESAKLILARATSLGIKEEIIRCALHFAVVGNQLEMAKYLIDEGAKTETYSTQQKMTPLMETSMFEMVQLLIDRGANVNANADNMYTPLYLAIANFRKPDLKEKDNVKILNLLLEKGANADSPVAGGVTPLMGAVEKIVPTKILVDKGAKLDIQNSNGETALMYAVKGGFLKTSFLMIPVTGSFTDAAKLLIDKGADVNLQDKWGKTALMHAAGGVNAQGDKYSTYTEMLEILLAKGAKLEVADKEGHTALYWAQRFGRTKSAKLLLAKGANPAKKYDRATDKSNVKAGIVGTWTYTQKIDSPLEHTSYTVTNKVVFNADWSYSKSMTASGQVMPDGGGYDSYDLRDGKIWLSNKMGTNSVLEFKLEGTTLILNGEKYTKAVKK